MSESQPHPDVSNQMYILIRSSGNSYAPEYLRSICLGSQKVSSGKCEPISMVWRWFLFPASHLSSMCASWYQVWLLGLWKCSLVLPWFPAYVTYEDAALFNQSYLPPSSEKPRNPENQKLGRSHPPADQNPSGQALKGTTFRLCFQWQSF